MTILATRPDTTSSGNRPQPGPGPRRPGPHPGFRPDIEGLRAVAVTVVVLFHAGLTVLDGGYVGVDVFFVISGFLITTQLLREVGSTGTISIPNFYARRALRLLPASSFVVGCTLVATWLWLPPLRVHAIATDALTTTFYGLNYRLALAGTDYLASTAAPSPLQHFWSLAVEEQFYLIWPPLLLLAARLGTSRRRHGRGRSPVPAPARTPAGPATGAGAGASRPGSAAVHASGAAPDATVPITMPGATTTFDTTADTTTGDTTAAFATTVDPTAGFAAPGAAPHPASAHTAAAHTAADTTAPNPTVPIAAPERAVPAAAPERAVPIAAPNTTAIVAVLLAGIAGSFALSVWLTGVSAPWAYFGAHTRAWELALGALVAVGAPALARLPRWSAVAGRWTGLAAVGLAAVVYTEQTAFPGYAAALPVLATALVIATGCADPSSRLLGAAPVQAIGRLSYGWYLWHWPVLVIGPYAFGQLSVVKSVGLAGLSLLLAIATSRRVEQPVRSLRRLRQRARQGLATGLALSAAVVVVALLVPVVLPTTTGTGRADDTAALLAGTSAAEQQLARLISDSVEASDVPGNLTPSLERASADIGAIYPDGCDPTFADATVKKPCLYGDPAGTSTVVLFGDSHAGHWFPAVNRIATERHWRLAMVTKSACSAASVAIYLPALKRHYTECDQWRDAAFEYIAALRPSMVIASSNGHGSALNLGDDADQGWARAWSDTFDRLPGSARLVLISDTAWPEGNVPECVSNHINSLTECNRPREAAFSDARRRRLVAEAARDHGGTVVDPAPWMCTEKSCPVVIGNTLVYTDDSHISATFSTLLAPLLAERLAQ